METDEVSTNFSREGGRNDLQGRPNREKHTFKLILNESPKVAGTWMSGQTAIEEEMFVCVRSIV